MVNNYIDHVTTRFRTAFDRTIDRLPDSVTNRVGATETIAFNVGLVLGFGGVAMLTLLYLSVDPAAAQSNVSGTGPDSGAGICDTSLMGFVRNGIGALVIIAPTLGLANAGINFSKAASTNKSNKKKEAKENIRSSIMYGIAGGSLVAIAGLITTWGPFSYCSF